MHMQENMDDPTLEQKVIQKIKPKIRRDIGNYIYLFMFSWLIVWVTNGDKFVSGVDFLFKLKDWVVLSFFAWYRDRIIRNVTVKFRLSFFFFLINKGCGATSSTWKCWGLLQCTSCKEGLTDWTPSPCNSAISIYGNPQNPNLFV